MSTYPREYYREIGGHIVELIKDSARDDWYIIVRAPNGCYCYDGWWGDSAHRSSEEAFAEAVSGAEIYQAPGE